MRDFNFHHLLYFRHVAHAGGIAALGLDLEHPLIGHDLLSLPADAPGRANMQCADAHGYRVGNHMVVHQARDPARRFLVDDQHRITATDEAWPGVAAKVTLPTGSA